MKTKLSRLVKKALTQKPLHRSYKRNLIHSYRYNENEGKENIMGKHGCGNKNENGDRLVDLCEVNNKLEEQFFLTKIFTKKHGYHQME